MKRRDAVLTLVAQLCERADLGRTSLQKATYFLDARRPIQLSHSAYFYGPFSPTVESELGALVTAGLVEETERRLGFVGSGGFEGRKYSYSLTDAGKKRLEEVRSTYPDDHEAIETFAGDLLDVSPTLDQRLLSAAAKVHYIEEREEQDLQPIQVVQVASQFGWDLSESKVQEVRELARRLAVSSRDVVDQTGSGKNG